MGVLRFPRPAALYIPKGEFNPLSPRLVTTNMISPPLSPDFSFDFETLPSDMLPALEYISNKLRTKMMHVTLIVGRQKPFSVDQGEPDFLITPITPLDTPTSEAFAQITARAAKKFPLESSSVWADTLQWSNSQQKGEKDTERRKYLVHRSIVQNEILFSQEGLTLLSIDRVYTLKHRLRALTEGRARMPEHVYIASCAKLLQKTIEDYNGRPFSKAFFHLIYDHLHVRDDLLVKVAGEYKLKYGTEGIVLPAPPKAAPAAPKKRLVRNESQNRYRQQRSSPSTTTSTIPRSITPRNMKTMKAATSTKENRTSKDNRVRRYEIPPTRGPKTPLSASDVTPITRNEWNILMGPGWNGHCRGQVTCIPVHVQQFVDWV